MHATKLSLPQRGLSARLLALLTAALLALALTASPALADDQHSGSTSCSLSEPYSWLQVRASGAGEARPPGLVSTRSFGHFGYETAHFSGAQHGGSWDVETGGAIDKGNTYGYCSAFG